jgi:hypothetical protein
MTQPAKTNKELEAERRQARLAAELRANLKKRKQQARTRVDAGRQADQDLGRDRDGRR